MNLFPHHTLWCEADLRFWDRFDSSCMVHRKRYPDAKSGDPIPRHHNVATADEFLCQEITIHTPDWQESARYDRMDGRGYRFRAYRAGDGRNYNRSYRGGHNWYGITRIDITFLPPDLPWYYWGVLYTGGNNSTCKLRRLTSTHQLTHLNIPTTATFTPLAHGIVQAHWTTRRHSRHGWIGRTQHHSAFCHYSTSHGWQTADSLNAAIRHKTLRRLNLQPHAA